MNKRLSVVAIRYVRVFSIFLSWNTLAFALTQQRCLRRQVCGNGWIPQQRILFALKSESSDIGSSSTSATPAETSSSRQIVASGRRRQVRRKPRNRRPKFYWTNPDNFIQEVEQFWLQHAQYSYSNSTDSGKQLILIPNEILLHYLNRNDLRAAIASQGGRELLAETLPARIMPGRWDQAVLAAEEGQLPEVKHLLEQNGQEFTPDQPPGTKTEARWLHQKDTRKPKGYWSMQRVLVELYDYVDGVRREHGRPSVWMPRPNELTASGRDDLKQAIDRFGGTKRVCQLAGMIPFKDWYYMEGQLELFMLLKEYLDEYGHGDYSTFPIVSEIRQRGNGRYAHLHSLIQYYGGRKFLAARLSMEGQSNQNMYMYFGQFDLVFGIRLLQFVRQDLLRKNPPLSSPQIWMPPSQKLLAASSKPQAPSFTSETSSGSVEDEGEWLHERILEYGGYENVARRMGLEYFGQ